MRYYLPWGIRYSSRCRKQALSLRLCTYMNLMSLSPGVLIVPWTDLLQIRHLQTSNKKINLWSDASDYQSTQDFRHCSTRPANESNEKKRKKKTPYARKIHQNATKLTGVQLWWKIILKHNVLILHFFSYFGEIADKKTLLKGVC